MKKIAFKFLYKGDLCDVDMIDFVRDAPFYTVAFKVPVKNGDKMEGIIARSDEGELIQG